MVHLYLMFLIILSRAFFSDVFLFVLFRGNQKTAPPSACNKRHLSGYKRWYRGVDHNGRTFLHVGHKATLLILSVCLYTFQNVVFCVTSAQCTLEDKNKLKSNKKSSVSLPQDCASTLITATCVTSSPLCRTYCFTALILSKKVH